MRWSRTRKDVQSFVSIETSQSKYVKIVHLLLIKRYFVSFVIFGTNYQYNLNHFDGKRKIGIMVQKQFLYEENKTNIYIQSI